MQDQLSRLQEEVTQCTRCSRLVDWRERVAKEKRKAYQDWDYWGKPVPSFGDHKARLLLVGLAPGAHGANRTGRMFTGDSSGDFLYAALHRAGFCNQPTSEHREDGLELIDAYITAAVRCVPPKNRPTAKEKNSCREYLIEEFQVLEDVEVVITLGKIAWDAVIRVLVESGHEFPSPKPKFAHLSVYSTPSYRIIGSYHPSPQNTNTGTLTQDMFDRVFHEARKILGKAS